MRFWLAAALALGCSAAAPAEAAGHARQARTAILRFDDTPFPYSGALPDQPDRPFLDIHDGTRAGHTSPRGGVHWQDETYSSKDVLLSIPPGFDPRKPFAIVLFLHGNNARLERDVWHRQQVVAQFAAARMNAVLVAPQFALDVRDSSAGNFWTPGFYTQFLAEAAERTATLMGDAKIREAFARAPVLMVAYSGGYNPAAYALTVGGNAKRVCGVILLDALFGEQPRFVQWLQGRGGAFFVSAYSKASLAQNLALEALLTQQGTAFEPSLGGRAPIEPGTIAFVPAVDAQHNDFVTQAWTAAPLRSLLSRVRGCR